MSEQESTSKLSVELNLENLKNKVKNYETIIGNTQKYRETWTQSLKQHIKDDLAAICKEADIKHEFIESQQYINLEALILSLGNVKSGIFESVPPDIETHLVRHNGSLVYQQIFNGKIMVQINYPFIDNYLEPRPPKVIAIYRPEEIKTPFILRHIETLISEVTAWEDYDDDEAMVPTKIGYNMTPHIKETKAEDLQSDNEGSGK